MKYCLYYFCTRAFQPLLGIKMWALKIYYREKSRKDKEPQDSDPGQVAVLPPCSQTWAIMELLTANNKCWITDRLVLILLISLYEDNTFGWLKRSIFELNNKASVVPGGETEKPPAQQNKQFRLFLQWVRDWKVKADKNRKAHQELQRPIFTKVIIIYLHIHLKVGNQFYWVSEKRHLSAELAWEKWFPRFSWCLRIPLKQPRKGLPYLYIQDTSFYTAVGANVCFLQPLWSGLAVGI